MNIGAEEAYRILEWKRVYDNELCRDDSDIDLTMSLIACLKDSSIPFRDSGVTYHHMYEHLRDHTYGEYYGNDM